MIWNFYNSVRIKTNTQSKFTNGSIVHFASDCTLHIEI